MQKWLQISLLLCTFGFLREMRPSEPFVTEYLAGDWRNLTSEQIYQEVFPFGTYSVLAQLVIVFLITDILRYKPIIIVSAIAGIILFALLLWTRKLWQLKVAQIFYGTFTAAEVAYYTYIYAKVDREHYQTVTGHTRAAILTGKCLAGVLAQLLVSFDVMSYRELHFISFATQIMSLVVSILLPKVARSLYFYRRNDNDEHSDATPKFSIRKACRLIWRHAVSAYTNPAVVLWSIWWALAICGLLQVIGFIQFLWKEIATENQSKYNGITEAVATLLGACGALSAGFLDSNKHRSFYMLLVCICTMIIGTLLFWAGYTEHVVVAYINYILFCAIFYFIITIAGAIIANNLVDDSFGLIFGINTLMAMLYQSIMTTVVITDIGFGLPPRQQYYVNSGFFYVLSIIYFIVLLVSILWRKFYKQQGNQENS